MPRKLVADFVSQQCKSQPASEIRQPPPSRGRVPRYSVRPQHSEEGESTWAEKVTAFLVRHHRLAAPQIKVKEVVLWMVNNYQP